MGSLDASIKILKDYGIMGLYRGFVPTVIRSGFGNIFYFGAYETILRASINSSQKSSEASVLARMIGGAVAGVFFMTSIYPMDYVKTVMQSDHL